MTFCGDIDWRYLSCGLYTCSSSIGGVNEHGCVARLDNAIWLLSMKL